MPKGVINHVAMNLVEDIRLIQQVSSTMPVTKSYVNGGYLAPLIWPLSFGSN